MDNDANDENRDDGITPSAQRAATLYGQDFANELLIKAELLARQQYQQTTDTHVRAVWKEIRQGWKRPIWKELSLGIGWACIGAFLPSFVDGLSAGVTPTGYVFVGILGFVFILPGLYRP